ncbi:MAG: 16S rRNA (guanine(966)-N(2))-methyltransferase RsmD [Anaerolineaceae bacterium]|nr:16S rRNA (guanine(966)-N(2))-methyltransferase RsmD [Anaerolineaceae bacterium]
MSNPRIIAGTAKGRRLFPVPGNITRPITDKVKGALFNILGIDIQNSVFLDLFGGTGSVGIEALSRGARFTRFIDKNRAAIAVIKKNIDLTQFKEKSEVFQTDALSYISKKADKKFDYIFIAPPQYKKIWENVITKLDRNLEWLNDDGLVIVQIDPKEFTNLELSYLTLTEERKYGNTILLFYEQI